MALPYSRITVRACGRAKDMRKFAYILKGPNEREANVDEKAREFLLRLDWFYLVAGFGGTQVARGMDNNLNYCLTCSVPRSDKYDDSSRLFRPGDNLFWLLEQSKIEPENFSAAFAKLYAREGMVPTPQDLRQYLNTLSYYCKQREDIVRVLELL